MSFGSDFLNGFFGSEYLKDYRHASKTFRSNGYELAPRFKYLFFVKFGLNTVGIPPLKAVFPADRNNELSLVVKSVDLPRYTIATETKNQYNRKRKVQSRIDYNPIQVRFHDDGSSLVSNLWYNYFSYYFKDPTYEYANTPIGTGTPGVDASGRSKGNYNNRDTYSANRENNDWGYVGESYTDGNTSASGKPRFFNDITVYGFNNNHEMIAYTLINPVITDWSHDTYDYNEDGAFMENTMTIEYETVKYYRGNVAHAERKGFADSAHYDRSPSPLKAPAGSTGSILGPGGLIDNASTLLSTIGDFANGNGSIAGILGAIQAGENISDILNSGNVIDIIESEATNIFKDFLRDGGAEYVINKVDSVIFPKASTNTNTETQTKNTPTSTTTNFNKPPTSEAP
jgi:hypothetical protein